MTFLGTKMINTIEVAPAILAASLADYLSEIFGKNLPNNYNQAINEFLSKKESLSALMKINWQQAAKELSDLQLNQLRRTPVEQAYDFLLYFLSKIFVAT